MTRADLRQQGALAERRRIVAYARDHAARVARAETKGRLTQKDRKLIVGRL